jgi:predicted anti-sigma-YlaC factor YlaD
MEHVDRMKLSAFLDGEVSGEEREEISIHLEECVGCRAEAQGLLQVAELLEATEDVVVSPYFLTRLKRTILEEDSRSGDFSLAGWVGRFHLERIIVPIGVTALLLLSLLAGSHLGTSIHRGRKGQTSRTDARIAEDFGMTAFDDFPRGSLGDAYTILVSEGGEE